MSPPGPCCPIGARPDVVELDAVLRQMTETFGALNRRTGAPKTSLQRHRAECLGLPPVRTGPTVGPTDGPSAKAPAKRKARTAKVADSSRTKRASSAPTDKIATSAEAIRTAELESKAIGLRLGGHTYRDIAVTLGIPKSSAHDLVVGVLRRRALETGEAADTARQLELDRLDRLLRGIWERAIDPTMASVDVPADNEAGMRAYDGQDKAIDRVLKIGERRAKLIGLDLSGEKAANSFTAAPEVHRFLRRLATMLEPMSYAETDREVVTRIKARVLEAMRTADDQPLPVEVIGDG